MSVKVTWLGHATWLVQTARHTLVIDPFLNDNPAAPCKADDIQCDYILVTHGHYDHVADVASIAQRCQAPVVGNYDLCQWLTNKQQVKETIGMNLGGGIALPFGHVKMTLAYHSSMLPDGSNGGNPCGYLLTIDDKKLYFAGDTALFMDMQQIGQVGLDLAVLPIGDLFTMGPEDAATAIEWLKPKHVLPGHYNTWPPIAQDAAQWGKKIQAETGALVHVIRPGEAVEI